MAMVSVMCHVNKGYETSLTKNKLYNAQWPVKGMATTFIRVKDDTGTYFLYPKRYFSVVINDERSPENP